MQENWSKCLPYYCQIVLKSKDMITVKHWKRTFPSANEEDSIAINMYVQTNSKVWQKLTRWASKLWTPQGLAEKAYTVAAIGQSMVGHTCSPSSWEAETRASLQIQGHSWFVWWVPGHLEATNT